MLLMEDLILLRWQYSELLSTEINDLTSMFFRVLMAHFFLLLKGIPVYRCIRIWCPLTYWRTSSLLPGFGNYEYSYCKHLCAGFLCESVWWMPGGAVASWFGIIKCSLKEPARLSSRVIISFCIPSEWLVNGSSCYSETLSAVAIVSFWILAIPVNGL